MFEIEYKYNELENDLTRLFKFATDEKQNLHPVDELKQQNLYLVDELKQQNLHLVDELELAKVYEDIKDALQLAKLYEIDRLKRSKGGRKSSANMTAEQRRERARKAGQAKRKN